MLASCMVLVCDVFYKYPLTQKSNQLSFPRSKKRELVALILLYSWLQLLSVLNGGSAVVD